MRRCPSFNNPTSSLTQATTSVIWNVPITCTLLPSLLPPHTTEKPSFTNVATAAMTFRAANPAAHAPGPEGVAEVGWV